MSCNIIILLWSLSNEARCGQLGSMRLSSGARCGVDAQKLTGRETVLINSSQITDSPVWLFSEMHFTPPSPCRMPEAGGHASALFVRTQITSRCCVKHATADILCSPAPPPFLDLFLHLLQRLASNPPLLSTPPDFNLTKKKKKSNCSAVGYLNPAQSSKQSLSSARLDDTRLNAPGLSIFPCTLSP